MVSDSNNESVVSTPMRERPVVARKKTNSAFTNSSAEKDLYSTSNVATAGEGDRLQDFNDQVTIGTAVNLQLRNHVGNGYECSMDGVLRSVQAHILRGEMLQIRQPTVHRYA